jgi:hypothetical protein
LVEIIQNEQDAATSMLRGLLDNVSFTNSPRMGVDQRNVTMDDVLNSEIGGIVRTEGSPMDKLMPLTVPFAAGETLGAIQYFDGVIQNKTGVSEAAAGLNPDALQNANIDAVGMLDRAAAAQPEAMARHLAEGGLTRLFRLLLKLIKKHPPEDASLMMDGAFQSVPLDQFDPEMDVTINVGLGSGQEAVKIAALNATFERQMGIWSEYGPKNGLVTMTGIRNTLSDILAYSGLHNTSRYWQPMNSQIEKQLADKAEAEAANQPDQPDPLVQAEQVKAQAMIQKAQQDAQIKIMQAQQNAALDVQRAQQDGTMKLAELQMKDDLARDQMLQQGIMQAAELLMQHGVQVDLNTLYAMQAAN